MSVEMKPARVNVMEYGGKEHLLKVVRGERATFYDLIDHVDDAGWQTPTACTEWQVRDVVGHMVDVTEAYLDRFALARAGQASPEALGTRVMARVADERAKSLRNVRRQDLIPRLKGASDKLFQLFDRLDAQQWSGELIPHVYMGPLPTFFYPSFQLMDYSVHSWDIRAGMGRSAPLTDDAAGTLVPFMFILLQATLDGDRCRGLDASWGVRVSGRYGGSWRLQLKDGALTYEEGSVTGCPVAFNFDANDFVLTSFQRIRGGVAIGDQALAERLRGLFYTI